VLEVLVALNSLGLMAMTIASYIAIDPDLTSLQPIYNEWTTPLFYQINVKPECGNDEVVVFSKTYDGTESKEDCSNAGQGCV
jgi:hypothetical protein